MRSADTAYMGEMPAAVVAVRCLFLFCVFFSLLYNARTCLFVVMFFVAVEFLF